MIMFTGWRVLLKGLAVIILGARFFTGSASGAEAQRFRVSYGGTAGYQLPLWVNRELGFSKKHGVDLEIILIQAGSPTFRRWSAAACN